MAGFQGPVGQDVAAEGVAYMCARFRTGPRSPTRRGRWLWRLQSIRCRGPSSPERGRSHRYSGWPGDGHGRRRRMLTDIQTVTNMIDMIFYLSSWSLQSTKITFSVILTRKKSWLEFRVGSKSVIIYIPELFGLNYCSILSVSFLFALVLFIKITA